MMGNPGLFWIGDGLSKEDNRRDHVCQSKIARTPEQRAALVGSIDSVMESNDIGRHTGVGTAPALRSVIFRAELDKDRKIRGSRAVAANGIKVNYSLDEHNAVVSMSSAGFGTMRQKAASYAESGKFRTRFDDFLRIGSNGGAGKVSAALDDWIGGTPTKRTVVLRFVPGIE